MLGSTIKVKLQRDLYDRLSAAADRAGYASTDELIIHILEQAAKLDKAQDEEEVNKQLRGLGYIE